MTCSCPDPDTRFVNTADSQEYWPSSVLSGAMIVSLFLVESNRYFVLGYKTAPFLLHVIVVSLKREVQIRLTKIP